MVENDTTGFADRDLKTRSLSETGKEAPESWSAKTAGRNFAPESRSARELFGRIDAMPVRRREMREK